MCPIEDLKILKGEFDRKIKHDFRKYTLLASTGIHFNEEAILKTVYEMKGYQRHKTVKHGYGPYTSHIIVMFEDEYSAREAITRVNIMNCGLTAILLDDMLRIWFLYETKIYPVPICSLTIIDIIGNPPLNLNFLTSNIVHTIFKDFGSPYLLPYTAALNQPHLQFVFCSMTEALSACMAFGVWYRFGDKVDCFSYRVRINPSIKEENLIKKFGGTPLEAFKLEYFVVLTKEIKMKLEHKSATDEKKFKTKTPVIESASKQRYATKNSSSKLINPFGHKTPILYVPIIIPNCYKALSSTDNQLSAKFATEMQNVQQNVMVQTEVAITSPEAKNGKPTVARHYRSSEINRCRACKKTGHLPIVSESRTHGSSKIRGSHRRVRFSNKNM